MRVVTAAHIARQERMDVGDVRVDLAGRPPRRKVSGGRAAQLAQVKGLAQIEVSSTRRLKPFGTR